MTKLLKYKMLGAIFFILSVGLIIGAQWYRLYIFPFPQLHEWKVLEYQRGIYVPPNVKLVTTIYSSKIPIFADRFYLDSIGDSRLEGIYLLQIPRHYSGNIRIKSTMDLVIYRAISDSNDNKNYDNDKWESSDIPINVKGGSASHTKIVNKTFLANKIIELSSGGPITSDPIFIKVIDYDAPPLKFKVEN